MKKDNFISIGLLLNNKTTIQSIEKLHNLINQKYNYFEIILLNYEIDIKDFNSSLKNKIEAIYSKINFTWEIIDGFSLDSGYKFRSVISYVLNKFNTINKEI
ncbi:hypothetical protein ACN2EN_04775 [Aliarcobacter lanthieri]|uniref:hypothetical protein n=1 Tax=Aliarcobacter lanthieri TaxID=1355374 RepID=UPI003AFAC9D8